MNKATFLKVLKKSLKKLQRSEIKRNISDYEELISDMMENGLTEEAAVEKIGSPTQAAREILSNTAPENFRKKDWPGIILVCFSAIFLVFSLCMFWTTRISQAAVSIIGGADGPTSIFIAGRVGRPMLLYLLTALILLGTVAYKVWRFFSMHTGN